MCDLFGRIILDLPHPYSVLGSYLWNASFEDLIDVGA